MRSYSLPLIAGLAASLIAAPVAARDDTVSVMVATHKLDLSKPADVACLHRKLGRAASAVCAMPGQRTVLDNQAFATCRNRALSEARLKADRAVAVANGVGAGAEAGVPTIQ